MKYELLFKPLQVRSLILKNRIACAPMTGSNSKMLSYDILTQFRDRGGEIRVYPLPFAEFYNEYKGDKRGRIIILMVVCRLLLHFNLREKLFEPYGKRKMGEDDSEWK